MTGETSPRPAFDHEGRLHFRMVVTFRPAPGKPESARWDTKVDTHVLTSPAELQLARLEITGDAAAKVNAAGRLLDVHTATLQVDTSAGWVDDGSWLDVALFPPSPTEVLARGVAEALADRARRQSREGRPS